jgi:hypothetical protein
MTAFYSMVITIGIIIMSIHPMILPMTVSKSAITVIMINPPSNMKKFAFVAKSCFPIIFHEFLSIHLSWFWWLIHSLNSLSLESFELSP